MSLEAIIKGWIGRRRFVEIIACVSFRERGRRAWQFHANLHFWLYVLEVCDNVEASKLFGSFILDLLSYVEDIHFANLSSLVMKNT